MRTIELFAGAGGMALGLEKAGFEHILLNEIDNNAVKTLKYNRPEWNIEHMGIEKLVQKDLLKTLNLKKGELDLLAGGPPCQSFSVAGKRKGLEDTRGTMFYYYAEILEQLKPKAFIFENVKGLLHHDKGQTLEIIRNTLKGTGYTLYQQVLNSWDYNVPQKRERLIIVGIRNDIKKEYIFPVKSDKKPVLKDVLTEDIINEDGDKYSENKLKVFKFVKAGGNFKDVTDQKLLKEYLGENMYSKKIGGGVLRRFSMDEPSLTILTKVQGKINERCHPTELRPFNIRECARIQSFPDEWGFIGGKGSQYKQIGNAVPVNLAKAIGESIKEILN